MSNSDKFTKDTIHRICDIVPVLYHVDIDGKKVHPLVAKFEPTVVVCDSYVNTQGERVITGYTLIECSLVPG